MARDPNRDKAKAMWLEADGNITNRRIAELLGVNEKKIAVWKHRDAWIVVPQTTESAVQHAKKRRYAAPEENRPNEGVRDERDGLVGNDNAVKHGMFAKYVPAETLELVEHLQHEDRIAKLKRNIAIQEAQIIRAQSIMHVKDKEELIKQLKMTRDAETSTTREWEFQYAWDRQSSFLSSLARAMSTLTQMYKLLAKLEPDDAGSDVRERVGSFVEALTGAAEDVWTDETAE